MGIMNNIQQLNLVNQRTQVTPNYDLSNAETSIKIYIHADKYLIVLGVVDNNYIYWASLTKVDSKDENEAIFNYISKGYINMVSTVLIVLRTINISMDELSTSFYCGLLKRKKPLDSGWDTPFGFSYGNDSSINLGTCFAKDVDYYFLTLQKLCSYRECDRYYINILNKYYNYLKSGEDDFNHYVLAKPLIEILENEKYLVVSKNEQIRFKYIECMQQSSKLYNNYMSTVR